MPRFNHRQSIFVYLCTKYDTVEQGIGVQLATPRHYAIYLVYE